MVSYFLYTVLLSLFSTAVLSYVSMAVMIGPWIDSTIVLCALVLFTLFCRKMAKEQQSLGVAYVTAGASIGGILATACGFSFPALYFLNPQLFSAWLASPLYFVSFMAALAFVAGAFGILVAHFFEQDLLLEQKMEFSVGQMVHGMIFAHNQTKKVIELTLGFAVSLAYGIVQTVTSLIPRGLVVFRAFSTNFFAVPALKLPMIELPMLFSIGFVTGHVIAIPLLIGIVSQIFVMAPLKMHWFAHLDAQSFSLAFGTGMILYGTVLSFLSLPKTIYAFLVKTKNSFTAQVFTQPLVRHYKFKDFAQYLVLAPCLLLFLTYCGFTPAAQCYLIVFSFIATHQLLIIGGTMGLAPLGRFATFVLIPGMLLFSFNHMQIMVVSTFIEIAGGVGVDVLFGRKMALMADLDKKKIALFQWLGLIVSSVSVGIFFWLLITKLGLGTEQLFAQKAHNRAMLFQVTSFDIFALIVGALYGAFLKDLKINPMLVLGGILMPIDYSILLVLGGLSTYLVRDKESLYPFWSGVFAANSLWMIIRALFYSIV